MAASKNRIILNPIPDADKKQVIAKLVKLTKQKEAQIAVIVEKAPLVIFKSVDNEKAELIRKFMGNAIRIEPLAPPTSTAGAPSIGFAEDDGQAGGSPPPVPPLAKVGGVVKPSPPRSGQVSSQASGSESEPDVGPEPKTVAKGNGKAFKDNFVDHSDENGFAYEFFCESCNKAYRPDYYPKPKGVGHSIGMFFKFIGLKVSGKYSGSLDDLKKEELRSVQRISFIKSLKSAEAHFLKCTGCGLYVCASCWNTNQKKCTACAPVSKDDLPIHERKKREKAEKERMARAQSKFCFSCGTEKKDGAKFCDVCGASYE